MMAFSGLCSLEGAVVGVAGATERIATGSRVTLDGTAGTVVIEENSVEQDLR